MSRSIPPSEIKVPLAYRNSEKLPELSLITDSSSASRAKLLFLSINTVEPRRYPSITFPLKFLNPSTAIELEPALISAPEHERLNEFDPAKVIVASSVPEVALVPDQAPDALQDEANVEDHVTDIVEFTSADVALAEIDTVADGSAGVEEPPPPPPQAEANRRIAPVTMIFLVF